MPNVKPGESRKDFVERCIPVVLDDGTAKDQVQAVAVCSSMYRERGKSLVMKMTKVQRLANGRIRWQARANTGEFDLLQERFDKAFFADVVANFYRVQEALSRGEQPPDGMTEPILDISHYSIYLPPDLRNLARAGWISKMWRDERALFAQGFFDDSRLGHLAAKAAIERPPEDRRVSIVVYPDYERIENESGGRIVYRGGSGVAWMDSLAMTSTPADPGATMEVKSMNIKEDARQVLGKEGAEVIAELEEARTAKALPDGAIVKSEDSNSEGETVDDEQQTDEIQFSTDAEGAVADAALTANELTEQLAALMPQFGAAINERLAPMQEQLDAMAGKTAEFEAKILALSDDQVAQVQKVVNNQSLFERMWPDTDKLSVQRSATGETAKGNVKSPEETKPKAGDVQSAFFGKR